MSDPIAGEMELWDDGGDMVPPLDPALEEAMTTFLRTGSMAAAARSVGMSTYELHKVTKTPQWMEEVALRKRMERAALEVSFTRILDTTLIKLMDRVENGETFIDKDGVERHREITASDLCKITQVVFDKRQLLRGLPTAVTNEGNKLTELARKLESLGKAQAARTIDEVK